MRPEPTRLQHPTQLEEISVRRLMSWRPLSDIRIVDSQLPQDKVRRWEAQLTQLRGACGCEQGGTGLLVGTVIVLAYVYGVSGGWNALTSTEIWISIGTLFLATSAGKILGLKRAQFQLQRAAREIRAQWSKYNDDTNQSRRKLMRNMETTECCGHASRRQRGIFHSQLPGTKVRLTGNRQTLSTVGRQR